MQIQQLKQIFMKRLLLIITGLFATYTSISQVPQIERDALIAIYNATNGSNWTTNTNWNTAEPVSTWYMVTVENNRVVGIDLSGNNLTGTIPSEVGNLTELIDLSFFANDVTGEVPAEIWTLSNLKTLWIGVQASKQLTLTNGIPPEISNLQQLEWLNVAEIALTQPLQPELFNLPNLLRLRIYDCGLTGTLPAEFAGIFSVYAHQNEFEGAIPQAFLDATGNQQLNIYDNYFDFSDLEPLVAANNYTTLNYSPQRTRDEEETVEAPPGTDITLDINDTNFNSINRDIAENNEYQWFKDTVLIPGADADTYTIFNAQESDSGLYYCEITNTDLPDLIIRRANIQLTIDDALSLNENTSNSVRIYPNPITDWLNIKLPNSQINSTISLYDINGRHVYYKEISSSMNAIEISNLQSGIYFVQIKTPQEIITKKIVKK
jgi:hypothetical protein